MFKQWIVLSTVYIVCFRRSDSREPRSDGGERANFALALLFELSRTLLSERLEQATR